jgi:hypothetical protein
VSLPHGWGHDLSDGLSVAATVAGVNMNRVVPPELDPLSGTAILNGVPVMLRRAAASPEQAQPPRLASVGAGSAPRRDRV